MFELTSLQDLTLSCYGQSGLLQHLPALVHFTRLVIDSPAGSEEMSTVDTDLAWRKLRNLQHVSVCHHMIAFGQGIFDLVELPNLRSVSFFGSDTNGQSNVECYAAFVYELAKLCPQTEVTLFTKVATAVRHVSDDTQA